MTLCGSILLDFLAVLISLLLIGYTSVTWHYSYWKRRNVPYFEPTFLFGNRPNTYTSGSSISVNDRVMDLYKRAKSKGYRHLGVYFMLKSVYLVVDVELVKHVMAKDFHHFTDRGMYSNEKNEPISGNIFAIGGERWKILRAKLSPTFTSGKIKAMFSTVLDCGLILEKYLEEYAEKKEPVDVKDALGRFSMDVIGSCAFGIECNSFKEPSAPFRTYCHKIFQPYSKPKALFRMIAMQNHKLARILGILQIRKELTDFFTKVVKDTVEYRESNNVQRNDFLQLLINARNKSEGKESKKDDTLLTMNEIVAQSFVFFAAGFESSASSMTFTLFELSRNAEIQDRVRIELETVLNKHGNRITYDSINELKYLDQVVEETMRKYPPLPITTRECVEDYKVPGEDVIIEKGTRVIIPVSGIHSDEDFYPDPEKFDPDRFNEENKKGRHQYAYIPFGAGPRICIGSRFGMIEMKVGLTCILRNFKVSLNEKTELPLKINPKSFVTTSIEGIWLNFQKL